jgi:hypothetical protein
MRIPSMVCSPIWTIGPLAISILVTTGCQKRNASEATNEIKSRLADKLSGLAAGALNKLDKPSVPDKDEPTPTMLAAAFVFQPSFKIADGEFKAGKAVAVKVPGAPGGVMVLSCLHILGPAGGMPHQLETADLPKSVQETKLIDLHGKEITIGPALAVPGAKPFALPDVSTDISAFVAPAFLASRALELATDKPSVGDSVWLLARVAGGAPPTMLLHRAHVRQSDDKMLGYEFDNNTLNLTATSGAAVLNTRGQVVGLNLGGGLVGKKLNVFANPITSVRKKIELALASAK